MRKPWVTMANGRYVLRWIDPLSLRMREKALGKNASDEEKLRARIKKEEELRSGVAQPPARLRWSKFIEEVERSYFPRIAPATRQNYRSTINVLAKHVKAKLVVDLTAERLDFFAGQLRGEKLTTATIRHHLRQLKALFRWGKRRGLLAVVPEIDMPKPVQGETVAKGRPLTDEEFASMLAGISKAIAVEEHRPSWEFFLRGLWASGLRIGEALALTWDDPTAVNVYVEEGRYYLHFPPSSQKARRDEHVPAAPGFAKLLETVPVDRRTGRVFKLGGFESKKVRVDDVSKVVSGIGEASGVVVKRYLQKGTVKFASAHDLRRSCLNRWATRLSTADLKAMGRHVSVSTTLSYYAIPQRQELAERVYDALEEVA